MRRLALALAFVLSACGSNGSTAPAAVTDALTRVDRLVAAHDWTAARSALDDLVRRTGAAREAGTLDDATAQRITAAAAQLAAVLPSATSPAASPTRAPSERPAPDQDRKDDKKHRKGDGHEGHGDD